MWSKHRRLNRELMAALIDMTAENREAASDLMAKIETLGAVASELSAKIEALAESGRERDRQTARRDRHVVISGVN